MHLPPATQSEDRCLNKCIFLLCIFQPPLPPQSLAKTPPKTLSASKSPKLPPPTAGSPTAPLALFNHERYNFQRNTLFRCDSGNHTLVADCTWWDGHVSTLELCLSIRDSHVDHAIVITDLTMLHDHHWMVFRDECETDSPGLAGLLVGSIASIGEGGSCGREGQNGWEMGEGQIDGEWRRVGVGDSCYVAWYCWGYECLGDSHDFGLVYADLPKIPYLFVTYQRGK